MILYLSRSRLDNFANSIYLKGLSELGCQVEAHYIEKSWTGRSKALKRVLRGKFDFLMIGYDSPWLVIGCRLFTRKKIVYDAILPAYERLITSRNLAGRWSAKGAYYWLIDFLAYHFADLVLLETDHQINFVSRFYLVGKKKLFRAWTGVDGDNFFYDPSVPKFPAFTVLFRGAFMPEAGTEHAIRAAKILEDQGIRFIIIGGGILLGEIRELVEELKPTNLELITDFLPYRKLRETMQKCHLSLGQLSDHSRLARTIPNKAYESLAMKLPYLTAANFGILELLMPNETCFTCVPADARSLVDKILWAKNNYSLAEKVAENGYQLYQNKLRSAVLTKNLLDRIQIPGVA